jgi:hypothetical protein
VLAQGGGSQPRVVSADSRYIKNDIDGSKGYENRDKELQQIVRDAELGKRLADKLMCVRRLDGEQQMILIHIEVKGDYDAQFAMNSIGFHQRQHLIQ